MISNGLTLNELSAEFHRIDGEYRARRVLTYMGYIGMCGPKRYGFSAVLVINMGPILAMHFAAILVTNRVSSHKQGIKCLVRLLIGHK